MSIASGAFLPVIILLISSWLTLRRCSTMVVGASCSCITLSVIMAIASGSCPAGMFSISVKSLVEPVETIWLSRAAVCFFQVPSSNLPASSSSFLMAMMAGRLTPVSACIARVPVPSCRSSMTFFRFSSGTFFPVQLIDGLVLRRSGSDSYSIPPLCP